MSTRGLATKDLLGHPDSVLDAKWLEAYHAGDALWAVLGSQGGGSFLRIKSMPKKSMDHGIS